MTTRDLPWDQDPDARALVAERGALSPVEIAEYLGITPQRVLQLVASGIRKLRDGGHLNAFRDHAESIQAWDLMDLHAPGDVGHRAWQGRSRSAA